MERGLHALLEESDRRVFALERDANTRRLVLARWFIAALGLMILVVEHAASSSLLAASAFFAVGSGLAGLQRVRRARPWLPWAVPLIDVPLVAMTQLLRLGEGALGHGIAVTAACLNLGFIMLASLSLSFPVVLTTAVSALIAFTVVSLRTGLSPVELNLAWAAFAVTAALMSWTTRRTIPLAMELRRQAWAGRYRIGPRLGAGGMAEVFEATLVRDDGYERKVALKRMLPALAERNDMQRLFLRELDLAVMMTHPNIVQVLDSGADEAGPFLVMEFVEGRSLWRVLRSMRSRGQRLEVDGCLELTAQLLRAVEHIHTRCDTAGHALGLMHRDLNPPNVMVTPQGELKVGDFGIARAALDVGLTGSGEMRGKAAWSAPEQLEGAKALTPALDLFALGVMFIEVATGVHPTNGLPPTPARLGEEWSSLRARRTDLPEAWWTLVEHALAGDPGKRPSATALLGRLQTLSWNVPQARRALGDLALERDVDQPGTLTR